MPLITQIQKLQENQMYSDENPHIWNNQYNSSHRNIASIHDTLYCKTEQDTLISELQRGKAMVPLVAAKSKADNEFTSKDESYEHQPEKRCQLIKSKKMCPSGKTPRMEANKSIGSVNINQLLDVYLRRSVEKLPRRTNKNRVSSGLKLLDLTLTKFSSRGSLIKQEPCRLKGGMAKDDFTEENSIADENQEDTLQLLTTSDQLLSEEPKSDLPPQHISDEFKDDGDNDFTDSIESTPSPKKSDIRTLISTGISLILGTHDNNIKIANIFVKPCLDTSGKAIALGRILIWTLHLMLICYIVFSNQCGTVIQEMRLGEIYSHSLFPITRYTVIIPSVCRVLIDAGVGSKVHIRFKEIDIGRSENIESLFLQQKSYTNTMLDWLKGGDYCPSDSVVISDGDAKILSGIYYCGIFSERADFNVGPSIFESRGRFATIWFKKSPTFIRHKGFRILFKTGNNIGKPFCDPYSYGDCEMDYPNAWMQYFDSNFLYMALSGPRYIKPHSTLKDVRKLFQSIVYGLGDYTSLVIVLTLIDITVWACNYIVIVYCIVWIITQIFSLLESQSITSLIHAWYVPHIQHNMMGILLVLLLEMTILVIITWYSESLPVMHMSAECSNVFVVVIVTTNIITIIFMQIVTYAHRVPPEINKPSDKPNKKMLQRRLTYTAAKVSQLSITLTSPHDVESLFEVQNKDGDADEGTIKSNPYKKVDRRSSSSGSLGRARSVGFIGLGAAISSDESNDDRQESKGKRRGSTLYEALGLDPVDISSEVKKKLKKHKKAGEKSKEGNRNKNEKVMDNPPEMTSNIVHNDEQKAEDSDIEFPTSDIIFPTRDKVPTYMEYEHRIENEINLKDMNILTNEGGQLPTKQELNPEAKETSNLQYDSDDKHPYNAKIKDGAHNNASREKTIFLPETDTLNTKYTNNLASTPSEPGDTALDRKNQDAIYEMIRDESEESVNITKTKIRLKYFAQEDLETESYDTIASQNRSSDTVDDGIDYNDGSHNTVPKVPSENSLSDESSLSSKHNLHDGDSRTALSRTVEDSLNNYIRGGVANNGVHTSQNEYFKNNQTKNSRQSEHVSQQPTTFSHEIINQSNSPQTAGLSGVSSLSRRSSNCVTMSRSEEIFLNQILHVKEHSPKTTLSQSSSDSNEDDIPKD